MNNLFEFDIKNHNKHTYLIGTDEAGRGPGAGPVFAAAVCFKNYDKNLISLFDRLNDSKQISEKVREQLYDIIIENCVYSIQIGSVEQIETLNILKTSLLMMKHSCEEVINKLANDDVLVFVDGNKKIIDFKYNQKTIVKGDSKSAAVAAASVLAKVSRDRFMQELDKEYPMYDWRKNKGYMTKSHLEAVDKYGLTKWHRKSFFTKHFEKSEQLLLF